MYIFFTNGFVAYTTYTTYTTYTISIYRRKRFNMILNSAIMNYPRTVVK